MEVYSTSMDQIILGRHNAQVSPRHATLAIKLHAKATYPSCAG